jgi:diguanylate cyclase (GGDEF)-like protein
MTSPPNRRREILAELGGLAAGLAGSRLPVSVLFLDVDGLKKFNDSFGHAQGDRVLNEISALVGSCLPPSTRFGRIGGDEFVAVLPGCELPEAIALAERARSACERDSPSCTLTITVGIATSPTKVAWSAEELLSLADYRMVAIRKGQSPNRNRVWAGSLPSDWDRQWSTDWPSVEAVLCQPAV